MAPPVSVIHSVMLRLFFIIECGIVRFLCTMHVFELRVSSSTFVPNFVSFVASVAELAYGEKSRTQSLPSLSDAPGTEACASEYVK